MDSLHCVVDIHREFFGDFHVLLRPGAGQMTARECIKVIGEEFIKHLHVCAKILADVESVKRSIAWGYTINGHHKFGVGNVDKEISLRRMVMMARQLNGFASEPDGFLVAEDYVR